MRPVAIKAFQKRERDAVPLEKRERGVRLFERRERSVEGSGKC